MKRYEKIVLASLGILAALALVAIAYTGGASDYFQQRRQSRSGSASRANAVDMSALTTAQTLAQLAATSTEREYAQDALRLGDHSVDLAFAAALRDATSNPPPQNDQTREITSRIKAAQAAVSADQGRVADLTTRLAKIPAADKDYLQNQLALEQAQLSLDQDGLQDAQQDLIRSGGDKQASIQQLLDQHEASEAHAVPSQGAGATASTAELNRARNIEAEVQGWLSLRSKGLQLAQAQQDALARSAKLDVSHEALEKKLNDEKEKNKSFLPATNRQASTSSTHVTSAYGTKYALIFLHQLTQDQLNLSDFDRRIETEQQLATVYGNWLGLVTARKGAFLHRFFQSMFWILLVALFVLVANIWIQRVFAHVTLERRRLHTLRTVTLVAIQAIGLVIILLIAFGMPSNFATALALATAGLTVALKDFIVGFFGWFVIMGKSGIRPGDWVEINGVGGEVVEVGLFHTVLLETGSLSEAGRPTGRKVSFVNSYAIEGHYFNFSTSGQWLWDEIEVQIPTGAELSTTAETILKMVTDETAANAKLAEEEWKRATPSAGRDSFSALPSLSLRPAGAGVGVVVRYITRVNERHEVRARIYRAIVDLLYQKKVS